MKIQNYALLVVTQFLRAPSSCYYFFNHLYAHYKKLPHEVNPIIIDVEACCRLFKAEKCKELPHEVDEYHLHLKEGTLILEATQKLPPFNSNAILEEVFEMGFNFVGLSLPSDQKVYISCCCPEKPPLSMDTLKAALAIMRRCRVHNLHYNQVENLLNIGLFVGGFMNGLAYEQFSTMFPGARMNRDYMGLMKYLRKEIPRERSDLTRHMHAILRDSEAL